MATHPSVEANPKANRNCIPEPDRTAKTATAAGRDEEQLFQSVSSARDLAPVAYIPSALAGNPKAHNLRRILTREQGRALELIGHAVDYLNDCYLYEGDENEPINIGGPSTQAVQILVAARSKILQSASVREPRRLRIWDRLFHRNSERKLALESHRKDDRTSQSKPVAVLPLSSSR